MRTFAALCLILVGLMGPSAALASTKLNAQKIILTTHDFPHPSRWNATCGVYDPWTQCDFTWFEPKNTGAAGNMYGSYIDVTVHVFDTKTESKSFYGQLTPAMFSADFNWHPTLIGERSEGMHHLGALNAAIPHGRIRNFHLVFLRGTVVVELTMEGKSVSPGTVAACARLMDRRIERLER